MREPVPVVWSPPWAYPAAPRRKRVEPGSLDAVERALWFGRPARASALLGAHPDTPRTAWLRTVALLAAGRYDDAADTPAPAGTGRWPALLGAALASVARQRGRYAEAARLDAGALAVAGADAEARADALVGLTADAVGGADPDTAAVRLAELDTVVGTAGWRAGVRRGWVACELALLTDRPADAAAAARDAVRRAELAQAPRHIAKSLLFYGVSMREVARRQAVVPLFRSAAVILGRAERLAAAVEAFPLLEVACRQLQETLKEVAVTGEAVAQNTYTKIAS
ncbi:MAG TPA: hypothetical protein VGN37_05450 [Actinocatenispora sp.]